MRTVESQIADLIEQYVSAVNSADADLLESLFWHDDPRFSEVENFVAAPFGQTDFLDIGNWIRKNAEPGHKQRFHNTQIHVLSDGVAYSVSLRDELETNGVSRVTLIYLKKEGVWKIIHGHFSDAPD